MGFYYAYLDENSRQGTYYNINVSDTKFQPMWISQPAFIR